MFSLKAPEFKSTPRIHCSPRNWNQKLLDFTKVGTRMYESSTPRLSIARNRWCPKRINFYKCGPVPGLLSASDMCLKVGGGLSPISELAITGLAFNQAQKVPLGMYIKIKLCSQLTMTGHWHPSIWWWAVAITLPY